VIALLVELMAGIALALCLYIVAVIRDSDRAAESDRWVARRAAPVVVEYQGRHRAPAQHRTAVA
jgi:hypothetical protein